VKVENLDLPSKIKEDYIDSGITELNPPQEKAVDAGLLENQDMIVAAPTASGKTFIAELAMVEQVIKQNKTAVYIVPLKALASEKYEDFKERYSNQEVKISVGDMDDEGEYLDTADIVVTTSEKLDSMLRHNPSWIHNIGLVVIDEIHLLTSQNRGPTLEVTITRLRELLEFQLLGLSATISNSDELAKWLNAELVESDYRPVELEEAVYEGNELEFYDKDGGEKEVSDSSDEKIGAEKNGDSDINSAFQTGTEMAEEDDEERYEPVRTQDIPDKHNSKVQNILADTLEQDKQGIVFCSSRKGAEKSSDRVAKVTEEDLTREEKSKLDEYAEIIENVLGSPTEQCKRLAENVRKGSAFHHAGLVNRQRQVVEEAFREGYIKSVCATPTLAAGVNLPAFRVIIRDLKRYTGNGMEFIPVLEYEQMCLPYDQKIVLSDGERRKIGDIVEEEQELEILSSNDGEIESKNITDFFCREAEFLEIKTETGSVEVTENHPVKTDEDWKDAGELEEGDNLKLLPDTVNSRNPFFFELMPEEAYVKDAGGIIEKFKKEFELTDAEVAEKLGISKSTIYHYKKNRKACPLEGVLQACEELEIRKSEIADTISLVKSSYGNTIDIPEKITENFMWLLGIILTDGNLNRTEDGRTGSTHTAIRVFNTNEEIIEKAKSAFRALGLECYEEEREEGKYRLEVGNTLLAQVMNEVFDIPYGAKSQDTKIPEIIFSLNGNLQASFIEGLFDGDGSYYENQEEYKRRIHFSSSSEKFTEDLQELLAAHGVKSRIDSKFVEKVDFGDEEYEVNKTSYSLKIRNKDSVNILADLINPVKAIIEREEYSSYHNSNNHRKKAKEHTEVLEIQEKGKEKVYNIEVEDNHNYITSNRTLLHNCGRAGRPKYDDKGEAISIAKNPGMTSEIVDRYIAGEPERIQSKLAVEPVLRMHTLALIASNFCNTHKELQDFYKKTFYAHQYSDIGSVEQKISKVVDQLREYEFLKEEKFEATPLGRRVSELYIDPDSANLILESLEKAEEKSTKPISYLFMMCHTSELQPRLNVNAKEESDYAKALDDAEEYILEQVPNEWDVEYEMFLEVMKTAMMLNAWIDESDEQEIVDRFNTAPGGIRAKVSNADWLLYASKELANMKELETGEIEKLRVRLKHGIKEELLSLVQYDQIGRVRARKLHDYGIRDAENIRETDFEKLKKLIGEKTARKLKKQVGQENIFDRENIMDYF
jgi:replicative superfamily II helicase/intein/homing endonuclease